MAGCKQAEWEGPELSSPAFEEMNMSNLEPATQLTTVVLVIVFASGIILTLGILWLQQRSKIRALQVLRAYAERGDEPPASVVEAVALAVRPPTASLTPATPPRRLTRGEHLAHVAGSVVLAAGSAGIAWWRVPEEGDPGVLMVVAVIAAVFFSGAAAARLVLAFTTADGRG